MLTQWHKFHQTIPFLGIAFGLLLVLSLSVRAQSYGEKLPLQLETFGSHSRLSIRLDKGIQVMIQEDVNHMTLLLEKISLFDLGAPFGSEKAWIERYSDIGDYRLSKIEVKEENAGVRILLHWRFPEGEKALHQPKMEHFQFRRSDEPLWVVDFWLAQRPTLADVKKSESRLAAIASAEKSKKAEIERKNYERQLASAEPLVLPEADIQDFCKVPKSIKEDIFLPFYPVHGEVDFTQWFSLATPDADYPYLEPTQEGSEAEHVRLALKLYRGGKPGLAIRTIEFFEKDFKNSEYSSQMAFLKANALIRLGHDEKAHLIFRKLMDSTTKSPVILHSGMYMAGRSYMEKSHLIALEYFNHLLKRFPNHRLSWVFHLGAAECLYAIGDSQRSTNEYTSAIEKAPDAASQMLAAEKLGDIFITRRQYEQALATYFRVIQHYEGKTKISPSVLFNRAEALFWLDQPERAEAEFRSIVDKIAAHPEAWRASVRIADVLSTSSDPQKRQEARKWYEHTINHYPTSPGTVIARIRLAECPDHGGLTLDAARRFFEVEVDRYPRIPEVKAAVMTNKFPDLAGLYHVRSMASFGAYDQAVVTAINRLRKVTRNSTVKQISRTLKIAFYKEMQRRLSDKNGFAALSYYRQYIEAIPQDDNPIPPQFLLQLSRHAAELGFGALAKKILVQFDHYSKNYFEKFTLEKTLKDRFDSEVHFTLAKVHWLHEGKSASELIRRELSALSPDSYYQSEKETLLGLLADAEGQTELALGHAMKAESFLSKLPDEQLKLARTPELKNWIADLQIKSGKPTEAAQVYAELQTLEVEKIREMASGSHQQTGDLLSLSVLGLKKMPTQNELKLLEAESYFNAKNFNAASQAFEKVIEAGNQDPRILFSYARVLNYTGDASNLKKSKEVLEKLANGQSDLVWKKMAQDVLNGSSQI